MKLNLNGQDTSLPDELSPPDMPLLWALRDLLQLTGTKFGCGVAACGACTVLVDGQPVRSCVTPLSAVEGRAVRSIENLGTPERPHALQKAWVQHQVPQCGYCQSGMLMAAAALLEGNRNPSDADIDAAITNLCRCGTYPRVRAAIKTAAAELRAADGRKQIPERRPLTPGARA
ncbi:MAG: (2Fe-2S)-binding protein [Pseudomonadota bacterium]